MAKVQRSNMVQTDSKGKVVREPRKDSSGESAKFDWWNAENDTEMAQDISSTLRFISRHQTPRIEQLTVSTRLYGQNTAYNMLGAAFTRASSINSNPSSQRISYNLCASVVDTLVAKMAKNRVIPTFLTSGGDWKMQRKAEKLSKFCEGIDYDQKVHGKTTYGFRDCGVWGDGFLHVCAQNERIYIERVLPHEIFVDMVETVACEHPRQLHRVKIADRSIVKEMFPDHAEEIDKVMPASYQEIGGQGTVADLVAVTESWHLRSGPDAKDGLKVICVGDLVVDKSEWEKDYFPFPHMYYSKRLLGFWGQGAVERLQNLQGEINRSMILEQRSRWMQSSFKILLETGSKVVTQHLNNDVGAIIHYTGTPPQYITPPAINPDNMMYINGLIDKGYKQEGVSTMSAQADKPAGVDSGKALRTLADIESDRFLFMEQEVEQFVLEVYRQAIEVAKDIYADKKSYEVSFPSANFMDTVDWKDIDLEADEYILRAYPTSSLPDDPAGRIQTVQEWMQAGLVSPRVGRRLMAMPDVEMADMLANAKEDLLHMVFEKIIDNEEYTAPEPQWDLQMAQSLYLDYYNYASLHNAPQKVLAMLRQFAGQVNDMLGLTQPQPMPGAMPMANPAPTPTSSMIPNVNTAQQAPAGA